MIKKRKNAVKPKHGQCLLLQLLWRKHGGPQAVALKLGVEWYKPGNWNRVGEVPLAHIEMVAKKLNVPIWGLNYRKLKKLGIKGMPDWEDTVRMYKFSRADEKAIMKLRIP